jgi:Ethanolamine utilization protein EutJ (predicted chaperonin)
MKTAMQELIEYLEVRDRKFTYTYKKATELLEKEKEQLGNKLGVVEIKQIISSTTGTKLTISEKHDLAVAIFEKLGGEVKSYIDEETKSDIVNKLTKKWNSGNQNK